MTHFLSKGNHLPAQRDQFAEATLLYYSLYETELGDVPWRSDLEPRAVRQTLGCLLARVSGKSPLEYLNEEARERQRLAVLAIMENPPDSIYGLVTEFYRRIAE
jgi:hypothetical protein